MAGLIIAGILAIVSIIDTVTAVVVALSQSFQTAHFVNNLPDCCLSLRDEKRYR